MEENKKQEDIDKILALSKEELDKIFSQMDATEVADLVKLINEVRE